MFARWCETLGLHKCEYEVSNTRLSVRDNEGHQQLVNGDTRITSPPTLADALRQPEEDPPLPCVGNGPDCQIHRSWVPHRWRCVRRYHSRLISSLRSVKFRHLGGIR
jgi:hypothetical protein